MNRNQSMPVQLTALIKDVFVENGFKTNPDVSDDLRAYVYKAAIQLLGTFQQRCGAWAVGTFGEEAASNLATRRHRFIEESLELCQSLGGTAEEAHALVDYVFNRPKGEPYQEVGGAMTTLAVLCRAAGLDMVQDGYTELFRVSDPDVAEKIRQKHLNKPKFGPLPQ